MIARIWRARATPQGATVYLTHITGGVLPKLAAIAGYRGASVLRRTDGASVELLVVTYWESMVAVQAFAGATPDVAVVEPAARAVLSDFDDFVDHFEVAHTARSLG